MAKPALLALATVATLLLAGCVTPVGQNLTTNNSQANDALKNVTNNNPGGQTGTPSLKVTFSTNWGPTSRAFQMVADVPALPPGFKVVVTERESGIKQEFDGAALVKRLGEKYDIPSQINLVDGRHLRIEAFLGGVSVGFREIVASSRSLGEPAGLEARASYSVLMSDVNKTLNNESDFYARGTMVVEATVPSNVVTKLTGTGTANQTSPGFSMKLQFPTVAEDAFNGNTTKSLTTGTGTWTTSNSDASGSGTATFRSEWLGREQKADRTGRLHLADKDITKINLQGSLTTSFGPISMTSEDVTHNWNRADTGELVWIQSTNTQTITGFDPQTTTRDSAATVEEAKSSGNLLDLAEFKGFHPFPFAAGDIFDMTGGEGIRIRYVVSDGGTRQTPEQSFPALKIQGTIDQGASGGETWYVVRDGPVGGLPLSATGSYTRGFETASLRFEILSIS